MPPYRLFCPACGLEQPDNAARCSTCGGLLGVDLLRTVPPGQPHPFAGVPGLGPLWLNDPVLPVSDPAAIVSLGEGGTPCLPAKHLGVGEGVALWLKNEAANPTGSFKDRQVSVGLSHARELGHDRFYVVSSGNVAAAASAYTARVGAECWVIAPSFAPPGKLLQIRLCGAHVIRVEGTPGRLFDLAEAAAARYGWHPLSTAARSSPFNIVGARTIATELVRQAPPFDWVIAPVGGGGLLGSLWQGFTDVARRQPGLPLPRLAAVQAAGCAPFVRAVERGETAQQAVADPWPDPRTIAGGLADDIPFDAHLALPAIRESKGVALAVDDDEIRAAQRLLARREGLFVEPSGIVSVAGLLRLLADGTIERGQTACCLLTGSGLKDPAAVGGLPDLPPIEPTMAALARVVEAPSPSGRGQG